MNNIEKIIGYHFKDENLLNMALTHSSYAHEHNMPCYERLEYLGDALVNFIVGEYLYSNFDLPAGQLTKYRACLVSTESFAKIIENLGLEQYILIGKSVQKISKSLLADIFESLLASIYLDGGKENADKFVQTKLLKSKENVLNIINLNMDYRTLLQEKLQAATPQKTMRWVLEKEEKVVNRKMFTISLYIDGEKIATSTQDTHKKCQQFCSKIVLEKLN